MIDDPQLIEVCGEPGVLLLVDGRERRLCRKHAPADAEVSEDAPQTGSER